MICKYPGRKLCHDALLKPLQAVGLSALGSVPYPVSVRAWSGLSPQYFRSTLYVSLYPVLNMSLIQGGKQLYTVLTFHVL